MKAEYLNALETRLRWLRWTEGADAFKVLWGVDSNMAAGYVHILESGPTYYMDRHFCEMVDHARSDAPEEFTFNREWLLSEDGWMFLEIPFQVPDMESQEDVAKLAEPVRSLKVHVGAIGWHMLRGEQMSSGGARAGDHWIATFVDYERLAGNGKGRGFGAWSYFTLRDGTRLGQRIEQFEREAANWQSTYRQDPNRRTHPQHEMRWIFTAFYLMSQKLAARVRHQTDRRTRRRAEHNKQTAPPFVDVVTLRRLEADRKREGAHKLVDWQWQWTVRGHWRQQWFPGEAIHKPVFVEAYVKGPEDKPLKEPHNKLFIAAR